MASKVRHSLTAVIYDKRGRVLSIGQNSYIKTHPRMAKYAQAVGLPEKQYLHAEIHAIIRCRDLTRAHRIFVSRWSRQGEPVNAKPCPVCMSAIRAAGIAVIEHT
jgi:tRNA(Arg) A34 adenosine deaminase TadA